MLVCSSDKPNSYPIISADLQGFRKLLSANGKTKLCVKI